MSSINETHRFFAPQLDVPPRLLLGPGPSNAHPRVLQAIAMPQIGHLDPAFIQVMNDIQEMLRYAWQTDNAFTLPVSGTGSAAMEAAIANLVEPGDVVLIGVIGYFGERLVEMASRYGADVRKIEKPWGEVFTLEEIRTAVEIHRPALLGLVHAETSTGALQPMDGVGDLCRAHDCLLLIDTVTSLGTAPIFLDEWGVDAAYSCSQKGLSCPPGASPFTMGERALAKLHGRRTKVPNWYLDMTTLSQYWDGKTRSYHHTAPINSMYAVREGLRLVVEEGLAARWARHQANAERLWDGLTELDLACHVNDPAHRIPALTTVRVPAGIDARDTAVRLLNDYNIEIAGGFSQLAGKVWRVGLMGHNSRPENVTLLLAALREILGR
ncbi:MAG TPA: alanine--glyoxylate aminotransferase family protein [Chloroflexota bacterium]|nr:alanine--glyoxylate aminotransferase family protein [Chloroflexota bacterium]